MTKKYRKLYILRTVLRDRRVSAEYFRLSHFVKGVSVSPNPKIIQKANAAAFRLCTPNSVDLFKLLCSFADREGETCGGGDCPGFSCFDCYRGIVALYALRNDVFYKFITDENNSGLKGVKTVRNSIRFAIKLGV